MPQTKVRAPDGSVFTVNHPEGATQEQIIAYAKENYQPQQAAPAADVPNQPINLMDAFGTDNPANIPAGYLEAGLSLGSNMLMTPVAGLSGIGAGLVNKGAELFGAPPPLPPAADVVRSVQGMAYAPKTDAGQAIMGSVGTLFQPIERAADYIGEVSGDPEDVLGATMVKTGILALPVLMGFGKSNMFERGYQNARGAIQRFTNRNAPAAPKPLQTPATTLLGADDIIEGGDKTTAAIFRSFKEMAGEDTVVSTQNVQNAAAAAVQRLEALGLGNQAFAKQLRMISGKSGMSLQRIDDLMFFLMNKKTKGLSPGIKQSIIDAAIEDVSALGKTMGVNFSDELLLARAMSDLYKPRANLTNVVSQWGKQIEGFRATNPEAFQQVMRDWTAGQVNRFVQQTANGRGFNGARFGSWVAENKPALTQLVGPEMVSVWEAFPKWQGRTGIISGIVSRIANAKTGGVSGMFSRQIDMQFADSLAEMLVDPNSTLFRTLAPSQRSVQMPPMSQQMLEAELARTQNAQK